MSVYRILIIIFETDDCKNLPEKSLDNNVSFCQDVIFDMKMSSLRKALVYFGIIKYNLDSRDRRCATFIADNRVSENAIAYAFNYFSLRKDFIYETIL